MQQAPVSAAEQQPADDYLQHLRAVHFALVLLSTILIGIALSGSEERLSGARNLVDRIGDLQYEWETGARSSMIAAAAPTVTKSYLLRLSALRDTPSLHPINVVLSVSASELERDQAWRILDENLTREPQTVEEFVRWWVSGTKGAHVLVPDFQNPVLGCSARLFETDAEKVRWLTDAHGNGVRMRCDVLSDSTERGGKIPEIAGSLQAVSGLSPTDTPFEAALKGTVNSLEPPRTSTGGTVIGVSLAIAVPLRVREVSATTVQSSLAGIARQLSLISSAVPRWYGFPQTFARCRRWLLGLALNRWMRVLAVTSISSAPLFLWTH